MRHHLKAILAAALLAFCAPAQAADPASIAVVDMQLLLTESAAGKDIQAQLETQKTGFLSAISEQEKKLREDEKALSEQRANLSAEEFAKKAKEFEGKLTETRRDAQEKKKAIEEAAANGLIKLKDEINKIVQKIADDEGYTIVINRQSVVISNKSIDITETVLAKLNKDVSKIALDVKSN